MQNGGGVLRAAKPVVAAAAFTLSGLAWAQTAEAPPEASGPDQAVVGDIVVTAQKRVQLLQDVGLSIAVETGESMLDRGVTSPTELGKIVPGLTVQPSPFNTPVYTLRGIGFYETTLSAAPTVAVYTDEIALPFSATTRGAAFDIERVEVLKGPQGTLFGQNTTGGAINYIVAKPTDEFSAGVDASIGRFETIDVQGFVSGPLGNGVKARLAVRTVQSGTWQTSYTRNDSLGKKNMWQARLLLDIEASERLKLNINLNGWRDRGDTQAAQMIYDDCGPSLEGTCGSPDAEQMRVYPRAPANNRAADWGYGIFDRRPQRDDYFIQASIRADYEINDNLTLTNLAAFSRYKTDSVQDFDGTIYASADTNTTGHINDLSEELRLSWDSDNLHLIVGGNYHYADTYDKLFYNFSEGPSSNPLWMIPGAPRGVLSYDYSRQDIREYAGFFNAEYDIAPQLMVVGGARYTQSNRSFDGCTYDYGGETAVWWNAIFGTNVPTGGCITLDANLQPYDTALFDKLNENNVSWNIGLNYKPQDSSLLYVRVSRGYKSGSFPTANVASYTGYAPVKQESVTAYEAGFKTRLLDRRVDLTGAVFYYDYTDKQLRGRLPDPVFGTLDGLVQIPKSRVWGLEGALLARPVDGFNLSLGATYINTRVKEFIGYNANGELSNFSGQRFPYAPNLTMTGDAEYEFRVSGDSRAYLGASFVHNSGTSTALANSNTQYVAADPRFHVKGYTVVDLRAGMRFPNNNVRAGIFVRNVGDTYYWANVQDTIATIVRYAGMPRTYGVQLSWKY